MADLYKVYNEIFRPEAPLRFRCSICGFQGRLDEMVLDYDELGWLHKTCVPKDKRGELLK